LNIFCSGLLFLPVFRFPDSIAPVVDPKIQIWGVRRK
jgi:hypothetical protein